MEITVQEIRNLILINSAMLHPDDADMQTEYIFKALVRYIGDEFAISISKGISVQDAHTTYSALFGELIGRLGYWKNLADALFVYRKETFEQDFTERFSKGVLSGLILQSAVRNKTSIAQAIKTIIAGNQQGEQCFPEDFLQVRGMPIKLTEANLTNNIWPKFKNAAHLWASLSHFQVDEDMPEISRCFIMLNSLRLKHPAAPIAGVVEFLSMANKYLDEACSFTPPHSGKPLLERSEAREIFLTPPPDHSATP